MGWTDLGFFPPLLAISLIKLKSMKGWILKHFLRLSRDVVCEKWRLDRSAFVFIIKITTTTNQVRLVSVALCLMNRHVSSLKNFMLIIRQQRCWRKKGIEKMLQFFSYFLFWETRLLFLSKNSFFFSLPHSTSNCYLDFLIPIESRRNNAARYCYANILLNMNSWCLRHWAEDLTLLKHWDLYRRKERNVVASDSLQTSKAHKY